jgi:hypothetical protein
MNLRETMRHEINSNENNGCATARKGGTIGKGT